MWYTVSVILAIIALAARVGIEYLAGEYDFLTVGIEYCDYILYACLALVGLMAILKIVRAFRKGRMPILGSVIATGAAGALYVLFSFLGGKYAVAEPWTPWIGYALIVLAVLMAVFILIRVILEIKKAR